MKCYLINLDRAPERLARMTEILGVHDIKFERIQAIDGRNFTQGEIQHYHQQRTISPKLSPGDIACGATHLKILQEIASGEDQYAVVIEDDVHFADDIGNFLKATDWIPENADIIKLETFGQVTTISFGAALPKGRRISRLLDRHWGTGLFLISKNAAAHVLNEFKPGMDTIDNYLFNQKLRVLNVYQVYPAPAVQDNVGRFYSADFLASDIANQRIEPSKIKPKGFAKFKRELFRVDNKLALAISIAWHRIIKRQIKGKICYKP